MGDKVEERRDSMTCSVVYGTEYKLYITAIKGNMLLDIDTNGVHNISRSRLKTPTLSVSPHPPISKIAKLFSFHL